MQVRLRRTGGIGGMTLDSGPVDTAELEPAHAEALAALAAGAAPAPGPAAAAVPDRFNYELTVGERSVRLSERELTPELRAAIKTLERRARGREPMQADAMHDAPRRLGRLDRDAERAERGGRRARVLAFEKPADMGRALGERSQHDGAVRNRLVARHGEVAADRAGRRARPAERRAQGSASSSRWFSSRLPMLMRTDSPSP